MAKGITTAQKTKIWTKASEIGMTEEQVRDLVRWISGQESTKKLTKRQGIRLIDLMEGKTSGPPQNPLRRGITLCPRKDKKIIGRFLSLASPKQIAFIENLKVEAGYDDDHLKNHIHKYHKVNSIYELDSGRAGRVIDFLKDRKKKLAFELAQAESEGV